MIKTQFFSDKYLEECKSLKSEEILEYLEKFRNLCALEEGKRTQSRLISIKIPEDLLDAFKRRAKSEGIPYQAQIKRLMKDWLLQSDDNH